MSDLYKIMEERERERIAYTERNEKNKVWKKKIKIYYAVSYGFFPFAFVVAMTAAGIKAIWLFYVLGVLFVLWIVWVIGGYCVLTCPHCNRQISHMAMRVQCCPYCGTKLGVFADLTPPDGRE